MRTGSRRPICDERESTLAAIEFTAGEVPVMTRTDAAFSSA